MKITAWSCVHPEKSPCDAPQGCGGAFCWRALGLDKEPPLPYDYTPPNAYVSYSYETIQMTDRVKIPWTKKINPLWWLVGPDGWTVPDVNNGSPYIPEVTNVWLRSFYWFICRNPLMNFVGFVLGVEDKNYSVTGSKPVLKTTGRDCEPPQLGWRWAVLHTKFSVAALLVALVALGLLFLNMWWLGLLVAVPIYVLLWTVVIISGTKALGRLPFVSYWSGHTEFYYGWRPASGGFGVKLVFPK